MTLLTVGILCTYINILYKYIIYIMYKSNNITQLSKANKMCKTT